MGERQGRGKRKGVGVGKRVEGDVPANACFSSVISRNGRNVYIQGVFFPTNSHRGICTMHRTQINYGLMSDWGEVPWYVKSQGNGKEMLLKISTWTTYSGCIYEARSRECLQVPPR